MFTLYINYKTISENNTSPVGVLVFNYSKYNVFSPHTETTEIICSCYYQWQSLYSGISVHLFLLFKVSRI